MIVMDLEWNRGYDRKRLSEILQIGAVKVDTLDKKIIDTFNAFIRPCVHKKYDHGAKFLPDLNESIRSDVSFVSAWAAFERWCGGDTVFAFWGTGDFDIVRENCRYWGLPHTEPKKVYDFQAAFSNALGGDGQQLALSRAVEYCGFPELFEYHNALYDSIYTTLVGMWLGDLATAETTEKAAQRKLRSKFSEFDFSALTHTVGPFPSPEKALNSRSARSPHCPVCDKKMWVREWYRQDPSRYLSTAECLEHGKFVCRLNLTGSAEITGSLSVPKIDDGLLKNLRLTQKRTDPIQCKSTGRHRCRRRKRKMGRSAN